MIVTIGRFNCFTDTRRKARAYHILTKELTGSEFSFSEENLVILSTGPLTGTGAPGEERKMAPADFTELLSLQTAPTVQANTVEPTPIPPPKELAQQKAIMKVYRKYQQREYGRIEHPNQFPSDYFFSALAELVLDN